MLQLWQVRPLRCWLLCPSSSSSTTSSVEHGLLWLRQIGHLIADCYTSKRGAGQSKGNYSKNKSSKKRNTKSNNSKNKKPYEKKRFVESDHYDSGDESGSEVLNISSHHQAPYVPDIQIQYLVQNQWQQHQQYLPPPQNQYMPIMNHQRPFLNSQPGYQQ